MALVGILIDEPWPQSAGQAWLRNLTIRTVIGRPYRHRQTLFRLIERWLLCESGHCHSSPDDLIRLF